MTDRRGSTESASAPLDPEAARLREALRRSEALLVGVMAGSADCILVLDLDGKLVEMNEPGRRMLGIADLQLHLDKTWADWWQGLDREQALAAVAAASAGGSGHFQAIARVPGGQDRTCGVSVRPLAGADEKPERLLCILREITNGHELLDTRRRLDAALAGGQIATWVWDIGSDRIQSDRNMAAFFNLTDDGRGLPAEAYLDALHPEDRLRIMGLVAEAIETGKDYVAEYQIVTFDPPRWAYSRGRVEYDAEGQPARLTGVVVDITARREAEQQLDLAIAAADLGTFDWDPNTDAILLSDRAGEIFGLSRGGPITRADMRKLLDEADAARAAAENERALAEHGEYNIEYQVIRPNGTRVWVAARGRAEYDSSGRPMRMRGIVADITERKRAEEALRNAAAEAQAAAEANAKFRTFFDQGTYFAGVMTTDGTIIEANRLCLDACGFRRDEVVGKKFWDCGWWNRSPELMEMVRAGSSQAAAGQTFRRETHYFLADGSERVVELVLAPVKDAAGRVLFIAPTGTDITEKKRLADERERLLDAERAARGDAERASRLKDEFLATLSHELRTPLNAILGWSQILNSDRRQPGEQDTAEGLRIIERNARAQAQIIEDLLDMSRIISGKVRLEIQQVDLGSAVAAAVETVRPTAQAKGVDLDVAIDSASAFVSGDPNRLQQVFWNLLTNAVKFTPRQGSVKVRMERTNSHLQVSVIDTGEGIKPEFLPHVFGRFRQADASTTRRHGGLGLGLAIVKQLVELHGGSVRVSSAGEKQGAAFYVCLPLNALPQGRDADSQPRHPRTGVLAIAKSDLSNVIRGVKVLIVDDELDARSLMKRLLEDCGAVVSVAGSAAEAMNRLAADQPDVLISDIGMPGEDGYSLLRHVRALPPERGGRTPALALTAYARNEDRHRSAMAGFQMHAAKPAEPAELIAMVASLAGRRPVRDNAGTTDPA